MAKNGIWGKNWFSGTGGPDWSWSYFDRALVKKNLQIYILLSPSSTMTGPSTLKPSTNQDMSYMTSSILIPRSFHKHLQLVSWTNQDQSFMILAFLAPRTFSKSSPTCVWSGPVILEPPGSHRITQDQTGPVLHDPCLSPQNFSKLLENATPETLVPQL